MTVKEVAKCLGVEESFILSLIKEELIGFFIIPRIAYDKRDWTIKTINTFEIDPEEVESIEICIIDGTLVEHIAWMIEREPNSSIRKRLNELLNEAKNITYYFKKI